MRALLMVDIQNDFLPKGSLAVTKGDEVIPVANALQPFFDCIVASQDWHPKNHSSFASNQGAGKKPGDVITLDGAPQVLWPDHCVQHSTGAELAGALHQAKIDKIVLKGTDYRLDSYSAFFDNAHRLDTGLGNYLRDRGVDEVYVLGLATDYCVKFTVLDAIGLGFKTFVVEDGCRGVNLKSEDSKAAFEQMRQQGAILVTSTDIEKGTT